MLNHEVRTAVALLAEAVRGVRPLAAGLGGPVRVPVPAAPPAAEDPLTPAELLDLLSGRLRVALSPAPQAPHEGLGVFEHVIGQRLEPALGRPELAGLAAGDRAEAAGIADLVAARSFDRFRAPADAVAADGARLPVYTAGDPAAPPVLLASACGMPAELCDTWLQSLGREHYAVTWETRGLFGEVRDFDRLGWDTQAQSDDVFAVMDHLGLPSAQLLGFCGGSVVGLHAAGRRPERIGSLSLWHGAYELGAASPKLDHHRNIQALMAMAAESRESAAAVHQVFLQTMLGSTPPDLAHLVLYPFATAELFYRYCRLNGAITDIDVTPLLAGVRQRTLVVTSEDDTTANPLGSAEVARRLTNATLQVEPHGDHISLFKMGGRLGDLALSFLRDVPTGAGARH
ncbi:alpha/beta hydrolase [Streptomyces sp. NBC_01485]|uniref:alpha/beta fold hydrolase n=1 Tax=Streptomyces sp. NBC_01485 TaxID=2903884 RepID=UPI002E31F658|nr:alpha/beta hydrolase [Streptomyces sp. NBC_01485]